MKCLTAAFVVSMLGCAPGAWATDPPPRVGATRLAPPAGPARQPAASGQPVAAPAAQARPLTDAELAARNKPKRRAVYQQFDEIPMRNTPPAPYGPQLRPEGQFSSLPLPRTELNPAPPVILNCVGSACTDAQGGSYRGGVGTTLMSPQGRLCVDNGLTVQCH